MLGLLVLTALNESLLYFSRVAAGATVLTLSIDWLWLRFQAIPGQDASSLLRNISSFEGLLALLSGRPLQLQLAVVSTLVTVSDSPSCAGSEVNNAFFCADTFEGVARDAAPAFAVFAACR